MAMAFGAQQGRARVLTMEPTRGDEVWVRGPGLNSAGAESRAEAILGVGWRLAVVKGQV